jgi:hypothetical protein
MAETGTFTGKLYHVVGAMNDTSQLIYLVWSYMMCGVEYVSYFGAGIYTFPKF